MEHRRRWYHFTGATDSFQLGGGSTTDFKQTAGLTLNKGITTPRSCRLIRWNYHRTGVNTAGF